MNVLFYGLLLAVLAFVIHLIIWRTCLPKSHTGALLKIFSLVLILGTAVLFKFPDVIKWNILSEKNLFEIAQFLLLFVSIAVAYIVSYPAIEVDSPTLIVIKAVSDAGSQGLDKSKLEEMMNNELLIMPRIKDMLSDGMVYSESGKYKLTPKGAVMARLFLWYRNLVGLAKGG